MARTKQSKKRKNVTVQEDTSSEERRSEDSPKDPKAASHIRTAENMLNASRKRREGKRKAIEAEHKQRVERVRAKIQSFYEDRKIKITKAQAAQWERLGALLKTRKSIEKVILSHLKSVEQTSMNLWSELDAMYKGRLEEIVEINTTGKVREIA